MTKKQLLITIATFLVGFGGTFYIIRTYFPKHKVENSVVTKDTLTKSEK